MAQNDTPWKVEMSVVVKARTAQEAVSTLRSWCLINQPPGHVGWLLGQATPTEELHVTP